jgi:hypothetical protein
MLYPRRELPLMAQVRQQLNSDHIADPRADLREKLLHAGLSQKVRPGARIAITAGSRGIGGFIEMLSGVVDAVRSVGGEPFIIPAMGSHGGATAEGQARLLTTLGVNEATVGAPIRATMETIPLGHAENGAVAHLDKIAAGADGIIVFGRVKTHPENAAGIASGLLKMTTVGLGKQTGAQEAHNHGLWESVENVPKITLAHAKVIFGVSVVENAFRKPVHIEVLPGTYEAFKESDQRLLKIAKPHLAKIPFDELDLLLVDEIGKTISGTGMDLNVIGNWRIKGGKHDPDFKRIVALSLTPGSCGNALGLGLADFTTERLMRDYDPHSTYINLLTATEPDSMNTREGPLPLALSSDREAAEVALYSTLAGDSPKVCRIKSTAMLDELWISESLIEGARSSSALDILSDPEPLPFDERGNLF